MGGCPGRFPGQARIRGSGRRPGAARGGRGGSPGRLSYIRDYSVPLVNAAPADDRLRAERRSDRGGQAASRRARAPFDRFTATERAVLAARQDRRTQTRAGRSSRARRSRGVGCPDRAARGYLTRAIGRAGPAGGHDGGPARRRGPLRANARDGVGEIGDLEHAFNTWGARSRRAATSFAGSPTSRPRCGASPRWSRRRRRRRRSSRSSPARWACSAAPTSRAWSATSRTARSTGVAGWSRSEAGELAVGTRFALEGVSIAALVLETGRPGAGGQLRRRPGPDRGRSSGARDPLVGRLSDRGRGPALGRDRRLDRRARCRSLRGRSPRSPSSPSSSPPRSRTRRAARSCRASRARVRRRGRRGPPPLVRDLHDGAQQRLVHTVVTLKMARQALEDGTARPRSSWRRRSCQPRRPRGTARAGARHPSVRADPRRPAGGSGGAGVARSPCRHRGGGRSSGSRRDRGDRVLRRERSADERGQALRGRAGLGHAPPR